MGKLKSDEKGFSTVEVILVLVIVALIGVVGFMVYKNHNKTAKASVSTATTTTKPAATTPAKTTPTPDPYTGWSTYKSTKEGLSFRYPANWTTQDDPCVNPTTQASGECIKIFTPKTASSPYYFDITYYWNQSDETGNNYVVSSTPLNISGAKTPLYLAATDVGIGDTSGKIYGLTLVNKNYPAGHTSKVASAIPSQSQTGILFAFSAAMTPLAGTQQALGYTPAQYQAQPDYNDVVKMFQSITYN